MYVENWFPFFSVIPDFSPFFQAKCPPCLLLLPHSVLSTCSETWYLFLLPEPARDFPFPLISQCQNAPIRVIATCCHRRHQTQSPSAAYYRTMPGKLRLTQKEIIVVPKKHRIVTWEWFSCLHTHRATVRRGVIRRDWCAAKTNHQKEEGDQTALGSSMMMKW